MKKYIALMLTFIFILLPCGSVFANNYETVSTYENVLIQNEEESASPEVILYDEDSSTEDISSLEELSVEDDSTEQDSIELMATTSYDIFVQGVEVTSANRKDVLGDGTVSYAPSNNTLYLKNADLSLKSCRPTWSDGETFLAGIAANAITINLSGENHISYTGKKDSENDVFAVAADFFNGKITLKGSGSLSISANGNNKKGRFNGLGSSTVYLEDTTLTISGQKCNGFFGIATTDYIDIKNSDVQITASEMPWFVHGLDGGSGMSITNSTVAIDVASDAKCDGITYSDTIVKNSDITIKAQSINNVCHGFNGGSLDLQEASNLHIEATTGTKAYAVNSNKFSVSDDSVVDLCAKTRAFETSMSDMKYDPSSALVSTSMSPDSLVDWKGDMDLGGKTSKYKYIRVPGSYVILKKIKIEGSKYSNHIYISDSKQLDVTLTPKNATNKEVTWSSSKPEVISVDENGIITAHAYGSVYITAKSKDSGLSDLVYFDARFRDVPVLAYYYYPVDNLAQKGIIGGYSDGRFGPDDQCTRKQLMIFLWRAAGEPKVNGEIHFPDVNYEPNTDSYKAILWGETKGLIKGYVNGNFGPDDPVTRKQAMIMLYRQFGRPSVSGEMPFTDMNKNPNTDAYKAVLWGSQNKVAGGYSDGRFRPNNPCLRKHIAAFIYRAFYKNK